MESIALILGKNELEKNPNVSRRIQSIIEDELGHSVRFADAGTVFDLHHLDPLYTRVPFLVILSGAEPEDVIKDWTEPIQRLFPSAERIETTQDRLAIFLNQKKRELSIGHSMELSPLVQSAAKIAYSHLDLFELGVDLLMKELTLTKSTLDRRFKELIGIGPSHFILRIKMEEAKRLVTETTVTLAEISDALGYAQPPSFDRAFHHHFGTSPTQMRQNAKRLSQKVNPLNQNAKVKQTAKQLNQTDKRLKQKG